MWDGNYPAALKHFQQALALGRTSGDGRSSSIALHELTALHFRLKDYDKALQWCAELRKQAQAMKSRERLASAYYWESLIEYARDNVEAGHVALDKTIDLARVTQLDDMLYLTTLNAAIYALDSKRYAETMRYAREALIVAARVGNADWNSKAHWTLGFAQVMSGQ